MCVDLRRGGAKQSARRGRRGSSHQLDQLDQQQHLRTLLMSLRPEDAAKVRFLLDKVADRPESHSHKRLCCFCCYCFQQTTGSALFTYFRFHFFQVKETLFSFHSLSF